MLTLQYQLLDKDAKPPQKAHSDDAAFDLYACSAKITEMFIEYGTGIAVAIPRGCVGIISARSSVSNIGLYLANGIGVIDAGYTGEIKARFYRSRSEYYDIGDRVAQLMIVKLPEVSIEHVEQLSNTQRGDGGFGSSGR